MNETPAFQPYPSQTYAQADRLTVGQALTWSWRRIADNPAPLLVGFAIWTVLTGVG
ncbi:putative proline rich protein, partial [human gut metagenome]